MKFALVGFFCGAVIALSAQQAPQPSFRSGIEVVQLDVSVTRHGPPVPGLAARDFTVIDNGVRQDVDSVTLVQVPLDVQLILDVSGSVGHGDRLMQLIAAADGLLSALRESDGAGLLTFGDTLRVRAELTQNIASVRTSLKGLNGQGSTRLRDAVQLGLALALKSETGARRPLVLVFTDGMDNGSWLSDETTIESARRAGIVIHGICIGLACDRPLPGLSPVHPTTFLWRLTEAASGKTWAASSDRDLGRLFSAALEEMRARYLLSFSPRGVARPGWHQLKVRLNHVNGDVVARTGYFVPAVPPVSK